MEFHEIANIFPMMNDVEINGLRESIKKGFDKYFPILLYEGKILDGRNRYKACQLEKIEPLYNDFTGDDPIEFVIKANSNRRHLTPGQKAFASLEAKRLYAEKAKENQVLSGKYDRFGNNQVFQNLEKPDYKIDDSINATQKAASLFGVNNDYVSSAAQIEEHAPDIADKVKSGDWTMNRAKSEYKRRKKKEAVEEYTQKIKNQPKQFKEYNVIYADPPWQYSDNAADKHNGIAENHYSTLGIDELKNFLTDKNIQTQKDAVLFLWVTNPFLKKALEVVDSWGFEYKSNIVWVKTELKKPGVGYYVRGRHELLFICTKGSFTPLDRNISPVGSVLESPIGEHSEKPEQVYSIIEKLYPSCVYLEIFARKKRDGWDSIGDET